MSIYENVIYPLRIDGERNKSVLDEVVERSLRGAAIWEEAKDRLNEAGTGLSGGQQQRLCIARAVATNPEVLLMDEPFGALDPNTRMDMQDLLVSLWRDLEATVFFITHSIEEAVYLGDRIYLLTNSPGTMFEEIEVAPPDKPSRVMQVESKFQETVYYIRDVITKMEREKGNVSVV